MRNVAVKHFLAATTIAVFFINNSTAWQYLHKPMHEYVWITRRRSLAIVVMRKFIGNMLGAGDNCSSYHNYSRHWCKLMNVYKRISATCRSYRCRLPPPRRCASAMQLLCDVVWQALHPFFAWLLTRRENLTQLSIYL